MPIFPLSVGEDKLNDSESLSRPRAWRFCNTLPCQGNTKEWSMYKDRFFKSNINRQGPNCKCRGGEWILNWSLQNQRWHPLTTLRKNSIWHNMLSAVNAMARRKESPGDGSGEVGGAKCSLGQSKIRGNLQEAISTLYLIYIRFFSPGCILKVFDGTHFFLLTPAQGPCRRPLHIQLARCKALPLHYSRYKNLY